MLLKVDCDCLFGPVALSPVYVCDMNAFTIHCLLDSFFLRSINVYFRPANSRLQQFRAAKFNSSLLYSEYSQLISITYTVYGYRAVLVFFDVATEISVELMWNLCHRHSCALKLPTPNISFFSRAAEYVSFFYILCFCLRGFSLSLTLYDLAAIVRLHSLSLARQKTHFSFTILNKEYQQTFCRNEKTRFYIDTNRHLRRRRLTNFNQFPCPSPWLAVSKSNRALLCVTAWIASLRLHSTIIIMKKKQQQATESPVIDSNRSIFA